MLGFFAAYAFVRGELRAKKLLLSLMLLPIIVPHVITAIAMYFLAGPLGWSATCSGSASATR